MVLELVVSTDYIQTCQGTISKRKEMAQLTSDFVPLQGQGSMLEHVSQE